MAQVALVHVSMFLPRNCSGDHLKVLHVMARWCLMALRTIPRRRRRMKKSGDAPCGCFMTSGAVAYKQLPVRIAGAVTSREVQAVLLGVPGHSHAEKGGHVLHHLARDARMARRICRQMRADAQERSMIHLGWPIGRLVLDMAAAAILDVRVKRRRLPGEIGSRGGVAGDAGSCFDAT